MADPSPPPPPPQQQSSSEGLGVVEMATAGLAAVAVGALVEKLGSAIPLVSNFGSGMKSAGATALEFSGISKELTKNLEVFGDLMKGDFSKAVVGLTEKLQTQIKGFQQLDVELIKLGRGANSRALIESIRQQAFEISNYGIGIADLTKANTELLKTYTGAIPLTDRQAKAYESNRKELGLLVSFYDKFGIAQADSIKMFNTFNNVMEGGTRGAQKFSDALLIFAQKTGQQAGTVFKEFNDNINRFSVLGSEKALQSFQKLEMAAARTGQSVKGILTSIERFDDIDTGFESGGQLNRVLSFMGGSFDTFRAMQASDEERAQMLYQAISGVAGNYQSLQTTAAKRSFAKQIAETAGMDLSTVMGLLNKSTNVAEDLSEIYKKPVISEEFTEQGRERAAVRVTTTEQLAKIQGQIFDLNPIVVRLSDEMQRNTIAVTKKEMELVSNIDKRYIKPLSEGGVEAFKQAGKDFFADIKKLPDEFKKMVGQFETEKKAKFDGVLEGNTRAFANLTTQTSRLATMLDKPIELKGTIEGAGGNARVSGTVTAPTTVADVASQTPLRSAPPPQPKGK